MITKSKSRKSVFELLKVLAVLLLVHLSVGAQAQKKITKIEYLSVENGLATEGAKVVYTDSHGVVWIGTENGLHRLINGEIEVFNEFSENGKLAGHAITAIFEDNKGNLWVGDRLNGITVHIAKTGEWKIHPPFFYKPTNTAVQEIIGFVQDRNGAVWACGYPFFIVKFQSPDSMQAIYKWRSPLAINEKKNTEFLGNIALSPQGDVLISSTLSGVFKFDEKGKTFLPYSLDGLSTDILPGTANFERVLKAYGTKGFLVNTSTKVFFIDAKTGKTKELAQTQKLKGLAYTINVDSSITIVQLPYIWEYDKNLNQTGFYKVITEEEYLENSLLSTNKACKDRENILWVATDTRVFKINPSHQYFNSITTKNKILSNNYVRAINIDSSQHLWVGSRYGLIVDKLKLNTSEYGLVIENEPTIPFRFNHGTLVVNQLCKTQKNEMLVATYRGLYAIKNNKINYLPNINRNENKEIVRQVWAIQQLGDGSFLLGTRYTGLTRLSEDMQSLQPMDIEVNGGNTWDPLTCVWNFFEDANNNLWVLTSHGLYKAISIGQKKIVLKKFTQLKSYSVWTACQTKDKQLWVGSIEGGIYCFDSTDKFIKNITVQDGLPSTSICALITDDYDNVWVSTPSAITKINVKNTRQTATYNYSDGVVVSGFNYKAVAKDKQGNIFFGTKKGIVYFHPSSFENQPNYAAPFLMMRKVLSDNLLINNLSEQNDKIVLQPHQRTVKFEPALISYSNVEKNKYLYLLDGYDNKWHEVEGEKPIIQYTQLPPGKYTLRIKAANNRGNAAINQLAIPIVVVARFWETLWFIALVLLTALSVVGVFIYLSLRTAKLHRKLITTEVDSLRAQMNPHFFFNALNSIQDFIFHQERRKAADYMASFAKLLRSILENSRKKLISLNEEVAFLKLYLALEALRFEGMLTYTISVDSTIDAGKVQMPPMLIQPIIENAIKHGLSPKEGNLLLTIRFESNERGFKCVITDNGVGRVAAKNISGHNSKGLLIIKERLVLMNRLYKTVFDIDIIDLKDEDGNAAGTEVVLTF